MTSDSKLCGENVSSALMEKLFFFWEQSCCYYSHHAAVLVRRSMPSLECGGKAAQSKGRSRAKVGSCGRKPEWLLTVGKVKEYNWKHEECRGFPALLDG